MPTKDEIQQQHERLRANRGTLAHYLMQRDGAGRLNVRPEVSHGIRQARAEIRRIKVTLREWGEQVEDQRDDEESPALLPQGDHRWWLALLPLIALIALIAIIVAAAQPQINSNASAPTPTTLMPPSSAPTQASTAKAATPTAEPVLPTAELAATLTSLRDLPVYPNPPDSLSYKWHVWREPYQLADQIDAGATPTVEDDARSYTRLKYNLQPNEFAGLAMTFSAPQDLSAYRFIQVRIGFNRVDEYCRLYLKEAGPDPDSPTPTPGAANGAGSDSGVMLGLVATYTAGIEKDEPDASGALLFTIPLDDFFPRTDRTRLIEIGLEASNNNVRPVEGRCDLYEVRMLPSFP